MILVNTHFEATSAYCGFSQQRGEPTEVAVPVLQHIEHKNPR